MQKILKRMLTIIGIIVLFSVYTCSADTSRQGVYRTGYGGWSSIGSPSGTLTGMAVNNRSMIETVYVTTTTGVYRHDERGWTSYDSLSGTPTGIAYNTRSMIETIYVTTTTGAYRHDDRGWTSYNSLSGTPTGIAYNTRSMTETVYVTTTTGVYRNDERGWYSYESLSETPIGVAYNDQYSFETIYVITASGVYRHDQSGWYSYSCPPGTPTGVTYYNGVLYVTTTSGIYCRYPSYDGWFSYSGPSGGPSGIPIGIAFRSGTDYVAIKDLPPEPVTLSAAGGQSRQVSLGWSGGGGATSFDIYRNSTYIANTTSMSYVDTGLADGTSYSYYVVAKNSGGNTTSNTVSATTNYLPVIFNVPLQNQIFSGNTTSFVPTVSVFDFNGDMLTCRLFIDSEPSPRDTKTVYNTATAQNVGFIAQNLGGLSEGSHTMMFTAYDGKNATESVISFRIDKTVPAIGTTYTDSTDTSINISGTAMDNMGMHAAPYYFAIGTNASGWTANTSHTFYSLWPNTLYSVDFLARDSVDYIAQKSHAVYTKAQRPSIIVSNPGEASLAVTISDNNPAYTEYMIKCGTQYVSGQGTLTGSPVWGVLPGKEITIKGLESNRLYEFSAKARNQAGIETADSDRRSGYTLAQPPLNLRAESILQNSIRLAWTAVAGATGYDIQVDGAIRDNGTSLTYTHTGLLAETAHTYRVRTRNASGAGNWSSPLTCTTLLERPGIPGGIGYTATRTSVALEWDSVLKASGYDVEVDGIVQDNRTSRTYIHNGLQPDSLHKYRVRAKNAGGAGDWSAYQEIRTLPDPPGPPSGVNSEITKTAIKLQWEVTPKTDSYHIEVDGLIIDNKSSTAYLHAGLTPFTRHQYRIRGVNAGGPGVWSKYYYFTTYPNDPYIPENVMAVSDGNSINLSWYMASYAWSYEVEIDGKDIKEVYGTEYAHEGLKAGSRHTYRVRSKNISGVSDWTSPISISASSNQTGQVLNISNLAAVVTTDTITLSWDSVDEGCQYEVEADGILIDNGFNTIFNHGGLKPETYHNYKIRVRSEDKEWGAVLSISTIPLPPGAPVISDNYAADDSIQIWWTPVKGAVSYDVEADGEVISGITDITYIHKYLLQGTTHQYRVRARTLVNISPWSERMEINTGSTEYIVNCTAGEKFDFSLLAYNVQDFNTVTFIVQYDEEELEVVDLFGGTPDKDILETGQIPGTNLSVKNMPGRIELTVTGNIVPGTNWSGEITDIIFKARITGTATITYKSDN